MLKLPSISNIVTWVASPTSSMSTTLNDFCADVRRLFGGSDSPLKYGLNCTIPAFVSSSVGSPTGISEELATRRWSLDSKKRRNASRISSLEVGGIVPRLYSVGCNDYGLPGRAPSSTAPVTEMTVQ